MAKLGGNILIYRLGSLGDTVIALPCFHKIRERFPNAKITVLTNRPIMDKAAPLEAVLGQGYFFNSVLDYPVGTRNPFVLLKLLLKIYSLKIDTVVNLAAARSRTSAKRDRWFFQVAGVKRLIGFPTRDEDFDLSIDPKTGEYEWEAKRLARRMESIGSVDLSADYSWDLRLTDTEYSTAMQILEQGSSDAPVIALSIGTKMQANDWGMHNWLNLVTRLNLVLPGWKLVLIGVAEEATFANTCLDVWKGAGINLCGKTSPRVSAAILQRARIFIGHDSGPMHLAACVGTPCVSVFSARNLPRQWYPRGDFNQVIYHQTDCAGCGLETCIQQQKKCILSITVDEVEQAVKKIVATHLINKH